MGNKIIIDEEVLDKLDERIKSIQLKLDKSKQPFHEYGNVTSKLTLKGLKEARDIILENSTTISIDEFHSLIQKQK
jgi:hypothetical protein